MPKVVTLGETMAVFVPALNEPLRYVSDYHVKIAGAESNVAIGLQKLGHTAGWISRVSNDEFGYLILNRIRAEGVDTSQVKFDDKHHSGIMFKERNYLNETRVTYYRSNSAASCLNPDDIDEDYIASAEILHFSGITPILSESCRLASLKATEFAKRNNTLVSFDPNIRMKLWNEKNHTQSIMELMRQADIVSLGVDEADFLLGTRNIDEIFSEIFAMGCAIYITIKNGAEGAWVGTKDIHVNIPPTKWTRIDAVGAGDAFNAGFIAGLLEQRPIEECGKMGNIMGGLATQTMGDTEGLPRKEEMQKYLNNTKIVYR